MVLQANKKMSNIILEEFDVCHQFMSNYVQFILPLNERNFVGLEHNVGCEDYVIFVNYDKKQFRDKIQ